jgi:formylglycine-generating enzyme
VSAGWSRRPGGLAWWRTMALSTCWAVACVDVLVLDDLVCPGHGGPQAVRTDGICVDSTEVTNGHYAAFLAEAPSVEDQPPTCRWNTSFEPTEGWPPPPGSQDYPVMAVDWCDARAFCAWAGKRLCGRVGGGPVPPQEHANAEMNEWYRACSAVGTRAYPYGDAFDAAACAIEGSRREVGTTAGCEGGFDGLFDMVGNVWEWEDACESDGPDGPGTTLCARRGGAVTTMPQEWSCGDLGWARRSQTQRDMGFRCCSG